MCLKRVVKMAEFQTVIRERERMCKQISDCDKCSISFHNNKTKSFCTSFIIEHPEEAERIIMRWSDEHPIMTNRRKFEEVFGFDILERFSFSEHDKEWLNKEYKDGDNHDG